MIEGLIEWMIVCLLFHHLLSNVRKAIMSFHGEHLTDVPG
jgi:hypothetical protein